MALELRFGELQQALNERSGAAPGSLDLSDELEGVGLVFYPASEHVQIAERCGQEVVELVGDSAGERAHALQLLSLPCLELQAPVLLLPPSPLTQVTEDKAEANGKTIVIEYPRGLDLGRELGTILAETGQLVGANRTSVRDGLDGWMGRLSDECAD